MLRASVVFTAMFGYVLSFHSVYAFHFIAATWFYTTVLKLVCGGTVILQQPKLLLPLALLTIYFIASGLWAVDANVWARYIVYWLCGVTALIAVYQSATDRDSLWRAAKLIGVLWALNMSSGLLEATGLLRLPMSPYSPYVSLFGYEGIDLTTLHKTAMAVLSTMPTGFNWNQNNFAFVLMLGLPFILLYHDRRYAVLGLLLALFLLISIGSKGIFLALVFMLILLPVYLGYSMKKAVLIVAILLIIGGGLLALLSVFNISFRGVDRLASAFDQLARGISLLAGDSIALKDSTGTRAQIYQFGLDKLIASRGWGLGLGGAESSLIHANFAIQSFHFFFLQMLVDLGVLIFGALIAAYLWLAFRLRSIGLGASDPMLGYLARACSISLIVAIPASISPSGVHYVLSYYIVIGLSLAVLKIHLIEEKHT